MIKQILESLYKNRKEQLYVFEKKNGSFKGTDYGTFIEETVGFAEYLLSRGMQQRKIMIFGENSKDWMVADLAVLGFVGVSVGVPKEWRPDDILYFVEKLDVACIIYSETMAEVVETVRAGKPDLCVISMQREMPAMIAQGLSLVKRKSDLFAFADKDEEICSKIYFTSGTGSYPKAVMLSLKNIFAGRKSLQRRCPFDETDASFLFLPLSHTYGGIYNFLYSLAFGFRLYLASSPKNMDVELREANPTIFCGVPLIYRRIYESSPEHFAKAFGSQIRYLFCGGAYLDEKIKQAYRKAGLNLQEAYALTETSSSLCIDYPNEQDLRCVGTVFEDIDVKILVEEDAEGGESRSTGAVNPVGEIVVKGDNVFLGYAGEADMTKSVFTQDGYFRTGDIGYIRDEKLYLCGRKKKIIIGENGENIDYQRIEQRIKEKSEAICKVQVFLRQERLSCYVFLTKEEDVDWAEFFRKINEEAPKYERISEYKIFHDSIQQFLPHEKLTSGTL